MQQQYVNGQILKESWKLVDRLFFLQSACKQIT